ncbi:hypothetical protein DCC85_02950 [Paenibacillus sp. CAA11]|uniref:hypothetical protein n=1 Tax=Paenibacillus sp. CAA11 TaxID=1532905 RepID=UPI000D3D9ADA|nr:hypothetical protein [Paenibacillus sp. CAA11]AWB43288.1 hypothetical protein DCC85_02950 [Paenibacillus sp. CAA11]
MKNKTKVITGALALAITIGSGALLSGQTYAASAADSGTAKASVQGSSAAAVKGKGGAHGQHVKLDDQAIAALLGITQTELKTQEKAGKSLAAITEEKGAEVQSVIALVSKQLTAALDEKLTSGSITQTEYNSSKAEIDTKAKNFVNHVFDGKGREGGLKGTRFDKSEIAVLLGVTEADLQTAERGGKSLAAVAAENGVSVQSVADLVTKQLSTALSKQLSDGSITQEQYDSKNAELADKVLKLVNAVYSGKDGRHGQHAEEGGSTAEQTTAS